MRRVLEITKKYPDFRPVRNLKNTNITDESRLSNAIGMAEGSDRYLDPYPGTFMNYVRHKVKNRKMFGDLANWYRLNPEKMKVMNDWHMEMGSKGQWSQGFMDNMIQSDIAQMAKTNFSMRNLTDHEKYMLALAKQRKQKAAQGADIIPFPGKKRFNEGGIASLQQPVQEFNETSPNRLFPENFTGEMIPTPQDEDPTMKMLFELFKKGPTRFENYFGREFGDYLRRKHGLKTYDDLKRDFGIEIAEDGTIRQDI